MVDNYPSREKVAMAKRLLECSLPWSVTSEELRQLFESCGTVADAVVLSEKSTGRSKGFGFVEYPNDAEALAAIEKFNGSELHGRKLVVNEAAPKAPKSLFMG
jgi:RNA recognition motif-containing protein